MIRPRFNNNYDNNDDNNSNKMVIDELHSLRVRKSTTQIIILRELSQVILQLYQHLS